MNTLEMAVCGFVIFLGCIVRAVYLKINYMVHYAICLEYSVGHGGFTSYPLYEYKLMEEGREVLYQNRGIATGYPREGKSYKVLIHKQNHNKIQGYSQLTCIICMGIFFLLNSIGLFVAWYM